MEIWITIKFASPSPKKRSARRAQFASFSTAHGSEDFPDGIFHANPQYFAIKQEPIGLIEAQGLFILPGRLVEQLQRLEDALFEGEELPEDLAEFAPQWAELLEKCEALSERTRENIHAVMEDEVGSVCYRILENTAVFPTRESLREFLKEIEELELQ